MRNNWLAALLKSRDEKERPKTEVEFFPPDFFLKQVEAHILNLESFPLRTNRERLQRLDLLHFHNATATSLENALRF